MASAPRSPPRFPVTLVRLLTKKLMVGVAVGFVPVSFLLQETANNAADIARSEMLVFM